MSEAVIPIRLRGRIGRQGSGIRKPTSDRTYTATIDTHSFYPVAESERDRQSPYTDPAQSDGKSFTENGTFEVFYTTRNPLLI